VAALPAPLALILPDLDATARLGQILGEMLLPGDVILLHGPLGAGKTTLTQALGRGGGIPPDCYITSPTYSLAHEYPGRLTIYHLDLYRLNTEEEIEELGFLEFIYGQGATIIEWPERLGGLQPGDALSVGLDFNGESGRSASLTPVGEQWLARLAKLASIVGQG
jgi:tRNA threonylcarbamoyladenosine biosynthesis protein TsaE